MSKRSGKLFLSHWYIPGIDCTEEDARATTADGTILNGILVAGRKPSEFRGFVFWSLEQLEGLLTLFRPTDKYRRLKAQFPSVVLPKTSERVPFETGRKVILAMTAVVTELAKIPEELVTIRYPDPRTICGWFPPMEEDREWMNTAEFVFAYLDADGSAHVHSFFSHEQGERCISQLSWYDLDRYAFGGSGILLPSWSERESIHLTGWTAHLLCGMYFTFNEVMCMLMNAPEA